MKTKLMTCTYCHAAQTQEETTPHFRTDEWHRRCPYSTQAHCPGCHTLLVEKHVLPAGHPNSPTI